MSSFAGVVLFVSFIICSYTPYFHYRLIFLHRFWWGGLFRVFRSRHFLSELLIVIAAIIILVGSSWSILLLFRCWFIIFFIGRLIFLIATFIFWWLLFLSILNIFASCYTVQLVQHSWSLCWPSLWTWWSPPCTCWSWSCWQLQFSMSIILDVSSDGLNEPDEVLLWLVEAGLFHCCIFFFICNNQFIFFFWWKLNVWFDDL